MISSPSLCSLPPAAVSPAVLSEADPSQLFLEPLAKRYVADVPVSIAVVNDLILIVKSGSDLLSTLDLGLQGQEGKKESCLVATLRTDV